MKAIAEAKDYSEAKLKELRERLGGTMPSGQLVVTCGSYARREASSASDLDYYSVLEDGDGGAATPAWEAQLRTDIEELIGKFPSPDGAFAKNTSSEQLLANYGGAKDSNVSITRRMLYLLEGEYLTCPGKFIHLRQQIIERYVGNTPRDHQLAFYLLNDLIRYWRTLAVDYADKTYGSSNPKPWPVRNIKLIFSRKLIYASGLFSVALTADRHHDDKCAILDYMFSLTPLERIKYVSGDYPSKRLFEMYDIFLSKISVEENRKHLDSLNDDTSKADPLFRQLKNEGHYFSRELIPSPSEVDSRGGFPRGQFSDSPEQASGGL